VITFKCPTCSHSMTVSNDYSGKAGKCKKCSTKIKVPELAIPEIKPEPVKAAEPVTPQVIYLQAPAYNTPRLMVLGLSCVGMIATFLPWASAPIVGSISGTGQDGFGDGWVSFVLFLLCAVFSVSGGLTYRMTEVSKFLIIICSFLVIGLFAWKYLNLVHAINSAGGGSVLRLTMQIGAGLYLVGVAGMLNIVALMIFNSESKVK
jgi:DNA-directed RNA polymerase subunit RPC12/RpoP